MPSLKNAQDYYEQLYKEFPDVPKSDIKRIMQFGLKSLYLNNSYGCDTLIKNNNFWFYCGTLMKNSLRYFNYYKSKMRTKIRVLYKRALTPWDGYYYFALTKRQYAAYLDQKNGRGRPRKNFKFEKVFLYKIYDECYIMESNKPAIFRIPGSIDLGFTRYKEELVTDKAELILEHKPLKFQEILSSNYNYQFKDINKHEVNKRK